VKRAITARTESQADCVALSCGSRFARDIFEVGHPRGHLFRSLTASPRGNE
jgi:hypothetical protein